ncbi:efflux RND transporter periplasmic adaptor subunit [Niveispirillum sp.]|uniref:efflux RND transporter periplasmic adaptor subunit n=1 Tax=Niveispirillum sp. TaxID=1917217 RepID=UPI0025FBBE0E|nr:efflux RND transporter periplasmic adaptor subunit [Niveispirillum sp.]
MALTLAACGRDAGGGGPGGMGAMPPPEVAVVTVNQAPYTLTSELTGRVTPYRVAEIRPQVSGIIKERLFTEGTDVKAGQPLYQIDPAPYRATLAQAQADLKSAEAQLTAVKAKAARYKELVAIKGVSQQEFDDAVSDLGAREAAVAAGRAAVETARINLDYAKLSSPIDGRVGRSRVTPGALVVAGQDTLLTTVTQLDPIYIDLTQSADAMAALRRQVAAGEATIPEGGKLKVRLILPDGTPYEHEGALDFSDITVDEGTGTVGLRATFPNKHLELLPGMFVRAVVDQGTRADAILVPQQAVIIGPGGAATTMVVGKDDKVEVRPVTAAKAVGDQWVVTKGLAAKDRVIVQGVLKAAPGAPVKPVPYNPAPAAAAAAPAPAH